MIEFWQLSSENIAKRADLEETLCALTGLRVRRRVLEQSLLTRFNKGEGS